MSQEFLRQTVIDLKDAWLGLRRRRVRSILSSLGITIGVIALVAMLSISEGAKRKELRRIASLGANTIRIENAVSEAQTGIDKSILNLSQGLNMDDAIALSKWLGKEGVVAPFNRQDEVNVHSGRRFLVTTILGVDANWFAAERAALRSGRPLVQGDARQHRRVCVIGPALATELHAGAGSVIHFENAPCEVVGILQPRGRLLTEGTGLAALDFDSLVAMPLDAFPFPRELGGEPVLDGMTLAMETRDEGSVTTAAERADQRLLQRHRGVRDYRLVAPVTLLRKARETHGLFALVMGSIAGLSLLVGGIGVMNAMLANVSEQTREIGLRMAVGATPGRITSLFLWHSVLLSVSGGVIGLVVGILVAWLVQQYAGWEVALAGPALLIGPLAAVVTGVLSGLHPAMRAAKMQPALSLREA